MRLTVLPIALFSLLAPALAAQNAAKISQSFEGKQVTVKIDMPGTQQGIDLYPQKDNPFDAKAYAKRMKSFPVAVHNGESVVVTTVKVKDKVIEFQLAGGGFGTFGDDSDTSAHFVSSSKSDREKDLENQLRNTDDRNERDRIQGELDYLRRQRDRDDQRSQIAAQQAADLKKITVDQQRASGGSRFNLKYDGKVPSGISAEQIMTILEPYVTFPASVTGSPGAAPDLATTPPVPAENAAATLQKGMTQQQVKDLLGNPTNMTDTDHDGLQVHTEIFTQGASVVHADFVNGILVRYSLDVR